LSPLGDNRAVLTIGTFDLYHVGHVRLLERAARFGILHVGVNSDNFVEGYKGRRPTVPQVQRLEVVRSHRNVACVWSNEGPGVDLINLLQPKLLAIGSDWHENAYLQQIGISQKELDELNCGVLYLPRTPGVSSRGLRT
jgi:cytidyltransferase-like protein